MNNETSQDLPATVAQMIYPFKAKSFRDQFEMALTDEFLKYETKTAELMETAARISINSNEDLDIAKARVIDTNTWIKKLVEEHKTIKAPILDLSKIIDGKKKKLEDSFASAKDTMQTKITFYETVQKRAKALELQKQADEKKAIDALILADTKKIEQIVSNVKSMLYGGVVINSKGTFQSKGVFSLPDAEHVEEAIKKGFPGPAMFRAECFPAYTEAAKAVTELIDARKTSLLSSPGTVLSANEMAILAESNTIVGNQASRLNAENKKIQKQIDDQEKGFRREIVYDVYDKTRVPMEFLMVDEQKLNQYKIDNREKILEQLKAPEGNGHGFIEGIRFRVEQTSIVR